MNQIIFFATNQRKKKKRGESFGHFDKKKQRTVTDCKRQFNSTTLLYEYQWKDLRYAR